MAQCPEQFAINPAGWFRRAYRDDQLLDLPPSCRRVVALAALKRRPVPRGWMCRMLWPTTRPDRATARLRTTLWRLRPLGAEALLVVSPQWIAIAPDVWVDWYDAVDLIGLLLGHADPADPIETSPPSCFPCCGRARLLEGWTDDWNAYARNTTTNCGWTPSTNSWVPARKTGSALRVRVVVNDFYSHIVK